jgi:hypothetical protein
MWAVLYGWTPEIFGTKSKFRDPYLPGRVVDILYNLVRGTACGIASALSRM